MSEQRSILDQIVEDTPADWPQSRRLAEALRGRAVWHQQRAENMRTEPQHEHGERWASMHDGIRWELETLARQLDGSER